ncbi:hypothetical protein LINPERPRIM_LOCUS22076, partial [Linum perenne]
SSDAARDSLSFKPLSFASDKSSLSVGLLRWSSLIFPNIQSCSGLRKEHRPSTLNDKKWTTEGINDSYSTELKLATVDRAGALCFRATPS